VEGQFNVSTQSLTFEYLQSAPSYVAWDRTTEKTLRLLHWPIVTGTDRIENTAAPLLPWDRPQENARRFYCCVAMLLLSNDVPQQK
jgi:hypothetical protein